MDSDNKEVRFDIYCQTCKHWNLNEVKDPCNECLEVAMREGTEKPDKWEKKE